MVERVNEILKTAFPNIDVNIELLPNGRVSGRVIWAGFTNDDHVARQQRIRTVLKDALGSDAVKVGLLLAYTPHELEVMQAA